MGRMKEEMMAAEDRGYWHIEGNVCLSCISDQDLRDLHAKHQAIGTCDFCENGETSIAHAQIIQEQVIKSLLSDYQDIEDAGAPYETREGGYQIQHNEACDIISENLTGVVSDELCSVIAESIGDIHWCERDWVLLSPQKRLQYGWNEFCDTVKHRLRFSFAWAKGTDGPNHPDHTSPYKTLVKLGDFIDSYNLITIISAGTLIYRVRVDKEHYFTSLDDLGTPHHQKAASNRMSPAGIPMFYGAIDIETAIQETWDGEKSAKASIATLRLKNDINVISLENLPRHPGYWSNPGRDTLAVIGFLHELAKDMSKPADRGSKVDLEYAPTQIVSEYLTKARYDGNESNTLGLAFNSSKTNNRNYALNIYHNTDSSRGSTIGDYFELVTVDHQELNPIISPSHNSTSS
jgi:hypothetical protein